MNKTDILEKFNIYITREQPEEKVEEPFKIIKKKNGSCVKCGLELITQGKRKNCFKETVSNIKTCIYCREVVKYRLNISYNEKDIFRKQFNIKWDSDNNCWYYEGHIEEMPKTLLLRVSK